MVSAMSTTPAGWYPDPWQPDTLHYWDGVRWTGRRAVPAPVPEPRPVLPLAVALGALVSMAVPLVLSRALLRPLARHDWPVAVYVVLAGVLAYGPPLVFWRYASRRWGTGRPAADVGLEVRKSDLGWGPLTWLSCLAAEAAVVAVVLMFDIPFRANTESVSDLKADRGYVIAMLVLAVVAAPVVEEIVFRGMVLRGLRSRLPVVAAVALQAVLFGCAHFAPERGVQNLGLVMVLSAVGAVLGGAAHLTRRLGPSIIAHAILNAVAMAVVLSGWSTDLEGKVVDEAHVAEPHGGDGHGVLVHRVGGLQRALVDKREMFEPGEWLLVDHLPADGHERVEPSFTRLVRSAHRVE